jgi:hypothetical protein
VEGPNDQRFFERIVESQLEQSYQTVRILTYANSTPRKVAQMMKSFQAIRVDYVFVTDNDHAPCIAKRKQSVQEK